MALPWRVSRDALATRPNATARQRGGAWRAWRGCIGSRHLAPYARNSHAADVYFRAYQLSILCYEAVEFVGKIKEADLPWERRELAKPQSRLSPPPPPHRPRRPPNPSSPPRPPAAACPPGALPAVRPPFPRNEVPPDWRAPPRSFSLPESFRVARARALLTYRRVRKDCDRFMCIVTTVYFKVIILEL
ncbi:unnamed protein product, partial [Iphiclides podalirius]